MAKKIAVLLFIIFSAGRLLSFGETAPGDKYLILIADLGNKPPPRSVLLAMKNNPEVRVTFTWPKGFAVPEEMKPLVKEKRAELAFTLNDEPIMPLVYNTEISTPVAIKFSAPEDLWDIVVRAKEEFRQNAQAPVKGLYLRSGVFSAQLIQGLKKLGVYWVGIADGSERGSGASIKDDFILVSARKNSFSGAAECLKWVNSEQGQFAAVVFNDTKPLTAEFVNGLAAIIRQNDNVRMIVPEQLLTKLKDKVPAADNSNPEPDLGPWLKSPLVWYELSIARKTVENYKNSGSANLETLGKLRNELYRLYDFGLIAALAKNPTKENEDIFQRGISNIYGLLGLPLDESIRALPTLQQSRPLSLEVTAQNLSVINSFSLLPGKNINQFYVTVTTVSITYFVDLDTTAVQAPFVVDIYMDLNNQEGAGLTKLLPAINGFMETNDAWEYALRIEEDKAALYRAGRFDPVQIKQFKMQMPWELEIPRNLLRGNPLQWGYQVITATQQAEGSYAINDFLAKDNETRQKLLSYNPIQLPAVRAQAAQNRGKKENQH